MLTQEDIESIARKIRDTGLHATWHDLLGLSKDAIGSLVDVFQRLLKTGESGVPTGGGENQRTTLEALSQALTLLTSEAQVSRWKSEALAEK